MSCRRVMENPTSHLECCTKATLRNLVTSEQLVFPLGIIDNTVQIITTGLRPCFDLILQDRT